MTLFVASRRYGLWNGTVWHAHDKETRTEDRLSLGKLSFALVGTVWRGDLAQVSDKSIKGTRWARDNQGAGTIMERYTNLRVIRKIFVRLGNVGLKIFGE
jgi:hypothetical protein